MMNAQEFFTEMDSPIGGLLLVGTATHLTQLGFQAGPRPVEIKTSWERNPKPFQSVREQLEAYFRGDLKQFEVSLAPDGTTFQRNVWQALREIPYAETVSYGELATQIGNPKAARAVGAANGRNPIPIIVPCHRVIGSTGSMIGFGGGISIKEALLSLERRYGSHQLALV